MPLTLSPSGTSGCLPQKGRSAAVTRARSTPQTCPRELPLTSGVCTGALPTLAVSTEPFSEEQPGPLL